MSDDDTTTKLVAELADAGEYVNEGEFTLSSAAARDKLREYQLAERDAYVLLLVEAAHLAGESAAERAIDFHLGGTLIMTLGAPLVSTPVFTNLFAAVFGRELASADPQLRRHARFMQTLGLAINAMLALRGSEVSIEYLDESGEGVVLEFARDGQAKILRGQDLGSLGRGRIRLRRGWSWKSFWMWNDECLSESMMVKERCRYASSPVRVDGEDIAGGLRAALLDATGAPLPGIVDVKTEAGAVIGAAARRSANHGAELLILTRGVLAETLARMHWPPGLRAIVDVDLRKDLSHHKIIRGAAFDAVIEAVEQSVAPLR